jgi:hypothetical protein
MNVEITACFDELGAERLGNAGNLVGVSGLWIGRKQNGRGKTGE